MPTVIIDGQEFDLPDEVTGHELRGLADIPPEKTVYTMEDGKHRVIGPDERVRLARGARVGTLQPFTTGGRRDVSEPVETRRLFVDGRELYVPANLTAFELHEMAEIPPERSLR